jgi:predicted RNase H-like nuclease (RuvC/YqgF family)
MTDEKDSKVGGPSAPGMEGGTREDQSDLAGENILSFLQKAVGLAEGNSRYAVDIAQRLSDQLYAAENRVGQLEARIADLEAEVQHYREKSERAEEWLSKISNEMQQQVR